MKYMLTVFSAERVNIAAIPLTELIPAKLSTFYRYEGSLKSHVAVQYMFTVFSAERVNIAAIPLTELISTKLSTFYRYEGCLKSHVAAQYNVDCIFS